MSEAVTQLSIPNLPVSIKERLEREAKKQDRSLASLLRIILEQYASGISDEKRKRAAEGVTA